MARDPDNSHPRQLGAAKLKAGTVIGFFLIVGGYHNEGVYFKKPTFYTDTNWNANGEKQHVLYRENECGSIVVGFEDKASSTADKDYNDIIFMVSDNTTNTETNVDIEDSFNHEVKTTIDNSKTIKDSFNKEVELDVDVKIEDSGNTVLPKPQHS